MHSSRMRTVRSSSRISGVYLVPGGVPGPRGVYLVPGGCTWSWGVYLVWGCTLSGGVYLVRGVYLVPGGVTGPWGVYLVPGGVPGLGGMYLVQGGVPGLGGAPGLGGVPGQALPLWTDTRLSKHNLRNFVADGNEKNTIPLLDLVRGFPKLVDRFCLLVCIFLKI